MKMNAYFKGKKTQFQNYNKTYQCIYINSNKNKNQIWIREIASHVLFH